MSPPSTIAVFLRCNILTHLTEMWNGQFSPLGKLCSKSIRFVMNRCWPCRSRKTKHIYNNSRIIMPHFVYADLAQILFDYLTGARVIYDCPKIALGKLCSKSIRFVMNRCWPCRSRKTKHIYNNSRIIMAHFVYADLAQILFDYLTGARVIYDCPKIAQCR